VVAVLLLQLEGRESKRVLKRERGEERRREEEGGTKKFGLAEGA